MTDSPSLASIVHEAWQRKGHNEQSEKSNDECFKAVTAFRSRLVQILQLSTKDEQAVYVPFQQGCGKHVQQMLRSEGLPTMVGIHTTLPECNELIVLFERSPTKLRTLLSRAWSSIR